MQYLSSAFDTINHSILLAKFGVNENIILYTIHYTLTLYTHIYTLTEINKVITDLEHYNNLNYLNLNTSKNESIIFSQ